MSVNKNKTVQGFFTLKEAAEIAKCSTVHLKTQIRSGNLKAFQPTGKGGTVIIPQGNLVAFLTSRTYDGGAGPVLKGKGK